METESGKRGKESGVRNRRYSIRYPFAAEVEMLELKSGSRVSGVTSDLSLGGCFMCVRRTLEVGARVRGTLTRDGQKVGMLAVVRVVKPHAGMGLEFLDIDPDSNYCCHGSKIFANRTETSLTSGGVHHMTEDVPGQKRRYPRIALPKGMFVAWHGGDLQLFSRVCTLSMGGLFISVPNPPPVGTKLRLAFEVPGGNVHAEAIVRNIVRCEGMGVEFTRLELKDRILLEKLLNRLLR